MKEYEAYKQLVQKYKPYITPLKTKVDKIVQERQLVSVMNDTKWLKLQAEVKSLPFPPPYIVKCLTDEADAFVGKLDFAPFWLGHWGNFEEEGMPVFFTIEWLKVCPRHSVFKGRLVKGEVWDETEAFVKILVSNNIPYEECDGIFSIFGYQ